MVASSSTGGKMPKTISITMLVLLLLGGVANAAHFHLEKVYQEVWCSQHNGQLEFPLDDLTRVDCLTDDYAIEFDYAYKWAESVGQALYFAAKTGKAPGVVLIIERMIDRKHLPKIKLLAEKYGIKVWEMVPEDVE